MGQEVQTHLLDGEVRRRAQPSDAKGRRNQQLIDRTSDVTETKAKPSILLASGGLAVGFQLSGIYETAKLGRRWRGETEGEG